MHIVFNDMVVITVRIVVIPRLLIYHPPPPPGTLTYVRKIPIQTELAFINHKSNYYLKTSKLPSIFRI